MVERTARVIALLIWLGLSACTQQQPAGTVLITGADRAIGLELARHYAENGWTVIATSRAPQEAKALRRLADHEQTLTIEPLDVRNDAEIDALARKYKDTPIDILINAEETGGDLKGQNVMSLPYDAFEDLMQTNVRGPLHMTEAFVEAVAASREKKIVTLTPAESSLAGAQKPDRYFYRASKAAVNIVMVTLAPDLSQRGIAIALIAPGGSEAPLDQRVEEIARLIDDLTPAQSGRFRRWDGQSLPW